MLRKKRLIVAGLAALTAAAAFFALFVGSSNMSLSEGFQALFGNGKPSQVRILQNIRLPRILAALLAGAALALSGLIMQTTLNNAMASPATLGVSNAAVFGANLSIIAFAGGFLSTGHNLQNYMAGVNPYATGLMAFVFAAGSVLFVLLLCKLRAFQPNAVVLAGIAIGFIWTAGTTILQFFATDVGISAAVVWTFGDLGRTTYKTDLILLIVTLAGFIFFLLMSWRYNALLSGDASAAAMGIHVERLRFFSLLISSLLTAVAVSFLGVIGFVGIICPHVVKRTLGQDHRISIPGSAVAGSLLLLLADTLSRSLGGGTALPVGAITSLLGAPFFLVLLLSGRRDH